MDGQNLLKMLWPADATDRRMFACVSLVRLLLVPGATLLLVRGLAALRLLPDDPVCTLSVLVQVRRAAMLPVLNRLDPSSPKSVHVHDHPCANDTAHAQMCCT